MRPRLGHLTAMSSDERLTNLEIKVTYQDELIETLNQVVIELRKQIDRVCSDMQRLREQTLEGVPNAGPADDKPPHY